MTALANTTMNTTDWAIDQDPAVLARIYEDAISIAIWQRQLQQEVECYVDELLRKSKTIALKLSGSPEKLMEEIQRVFPPACFPPTLTSQQSSCISAATFYADIHNVLDMFSCLFDAKILGLRINTLEHAMCPRFHTDNVAIRLITTYYGLATEWLPDQLSNRTARALRLPAKLIHPVPSPQVKTTSNAWQRVMWLYSKASCGRVMRGEALFTAHQRRPSNNPNVWW